LTVFSGLRRFYEYHIAFPEVHVYVSDEKVGWAVFYNSHFGSVDIDLVGPSIGGSFLEVVIQKPHKRRTTTSTFLPKDIITHEQAIRIGSSLQVFIIVATRLL